MSERNQGQNSPARSVMRRRLIRSSRLLVVAVAALAILAIADLISLPGAAIMLAVLVAAMVSIPSERSVPRGAGLRAPDPTERLLPGTRSLAQSLPAPCFILGADGTVRYANDRAIATFGIETGELLPFRLRHPELVAAFTRVTRGGGPQQVQFVERVPAERTFQAWFAPLDQTPGQEAYLLTLDDLTEAKATERMRVDFVANASHELRTPLASLAGFVETLQGPAKDDAEARNRFLAMMHEQAMRMSRLIDDLLSLSRIEMRAHVVPREKLDLVHLVRHVVDTMAPLASELGVRIEAELPQAEILIAGDRDELVQVFNNLVENACKYGQSGEKVVVEIATSGDNGPCSVSITDFGPGIAPEHLPHLTERFYRVDADESRRHRGTGLGLAIVKHIVSRHRARLQIESRPGAGARFTIHFPDSETIPSSRLEDREAIQTVSAS